MGYGMVLAKVHRACGQTQRSIDKQCGVGLCQLFPLVSWPNPFHNLLCGVGAGSPPATFPRLPHQLASSWLLAAGGNQGKSLPVLSRSYRDSGEPPPLTDGDTPNTSRTLMLYSEPLGGPHLQTWDIQSIASQASSLNF